MTEKVLHLIHSPQLRGAEIFALDLAGNLPARYESAVCAVYRSGEDSLLRRRPVRALNARDGIVDHALGLNWAALVNLHRFVRKEQCRVLIAHGGSTLKYAAALKLANRNLSIVYRCIGIPSYWVKRRATIAANRFMLLRTDAIVCTGEAARTDFCRLYRVSNERLRVIPNGIDLDRYAGTAGDEDRRRTRDLLGVPEGAFLIVAVGRLSGEKGHDDLVQLLQNLRSFGFDARVVVAGSGPRFDALQDLARASGVGPQFRMLGEREDIPEILRAADLFVLSSRTEGMPAALIEAGICGLSTVAYRVGGVSEVVRDGEDGILVAPGDMDAMTAAIRCLIGNPRLRRRLGETARERWRERFDIRRIALSYAEVLDDVLEGVTQEHALAKAS